MWFFQDVCALLTRVDGMKNKLKDGIVYNLVLAGSWGADRAALKAIFTGLIRAADPSVGKLDNIQKFLFTCSFVCGN